MSGGARSARPAGNGVRFDFEGRSIDAGPGQTIAGALHAAGIRTLSWSSKLRRPRGYRCGAGACPGCTLRVDGLPGVLACMTPVCGGERVQRIRPWLGWLPVDRFGWLVPAGFHGGRLFRSPRAWGVAERVLARLAGQAPLPADGAAVAGTFGVRSVDILVVGAGRAGLEAATVAAREGRTVLVVERDVAPGGRLLLEPGGAETAGRLAAAARDGGAEILLGATAIGGFDDGEQGVVTRGGLLLVMAERTILTTGYLDREVTLPDGDRPGVMLASAVRRLVVREGVRPGDRALLVGSGEEGGREADALGTLLAGAGVAVVGRCGAAEVGAIHGRAHVTGATVAGRRLRCDLVVISAGRRASDELARQADVPEEPRVTRP